MFTLKKALAPFLMPPGIFVSILLVAGAVQFAGKKRASGLFSIVLGGLMWCLSISPVADAVIRPLETGFDLPEHPKGDVIVMLCGGSDARSPDLTGKGALSPPSMARMVAAARLQRRLGVPVIISGGSVWRGSQAEASIARRYMIDLGIPAHRILVEARSRDTFQNAANTTDMLTASGFKRPILVTSASHLRRSVWCFEKAGQTVQPFPADRHTYAGKSYHWTAFLPRSFSVVSAALHEYLGLVYYRLRQGI
jgi:uncharacterized SAM-binding protein YcdF (DUF218 family)